MRRRQRINAFTISWRQQYSCRRASACSENFQSPNMVSVFEFHYSLLAQKKIIPPSRRTVITNSSWPCIKKIKPWRFTNIYVTLPTIVQVLKKPVWEVLLPHSIDDAAEWVWPCGIFAYTHIVVWTAFRKRCVWQKTKEIFSIFWESHLSNKSGQWNRLISSRSNSTRWSWRWRKLWKSEFNIMVVLQEYSDWSLKKKILPNDGRVTQLRKAGGKQRLIWTVFKCWCREFDPFKHLACTGTRNEMWDYWQSSVTEHFGVKTGEILTQEKNEKDSFAWSPS